MTNDFLAPFYSQRNNIYIFDEDNYFDRNLEFIKKSNITTIILTPTILEIEQAE